MSPIAVLSDWSSKEVKRNLATTDLLPKSLLAGFADSHNMIFTPSATKKQLATWPSQQKSSPPSVGCNPPPINAGRLPPPRTPSRRLSLRMKQNPGWGVVVFTRDIR
eukprot:2256189-Amphidinium_carterae.1